MDPRDCKGLYFISDERHGPKPTIFQVQVDSDRMLKIYANFCARNDLYYPIKLCISDSMKPSKILIDIVSKKMDSTLKFSFLPNSC